MCRDHNLGIIREFHTRNVLIIVDAIEDDGADMSWDEDGEASRNIANGVWQLFTVRVRAFVRGHEVAADYLGGCIYPRIEDFQNHRECGAQTRKLRAEGSKAICGSYFADMVGNVCEQARAELRDLKSIRVRA